MNGADLTGANLQQANLNGTTLIGVDLTNANLTWANLDKTDFTNAILSGAIFDKTDVSNVIGLTASAMNSLGSWKDIKTADQIEETWQIMANVCQGTGYTDARVYIPGSLTKDTFTQNIFAISSADNYQVSDPAKFDGQPYNSLRRWQIIPPQLTSLTACFNGHEIYYGTCNYSSGKYSEGFRPQTEIKRAKYNVTVEIRETHTANVIASENFYSKPPRECPEKITQGADAGVTEYVNANLIWKWIEETLTK